MENSAAREADGCRGLHHHDAAVAHLRLGFEQRGKVRRAVERLVRDIEIGPEVVQALERVLDRPDRVDAAVAADERRELAARRVNDPRVKRTSPSVHVRLSKTRPATSGAAGARAGPRIRIWSVSVSASSSSQGARKGCCRC